MTDLKYDPEAPYVFRFSTGDAPLAKFRHKIDADAFAENYAHGHVTDTTPPPPLPSEYGVWIFSHEGSKYPSNILVHLNNGWFTIWNTDASRHRQSDAEVRELLNSRAARKIA